MELPPGVMELDAPAPEAEIQSTGLPPGVSFMESAPAPLPSGVVDLEAEQPSLASRAPMIVKAMGVGASSLLSNMLTGAAGASSGTDLESPLNQLARAVKNMGAFGIPATVDPEIQQEVAQASSGPMVGEGSLNTWSSIIGQQVPLTALMASLSGGTSMAAKMLGAAPRVAGGLGVIASMGGISLAESGGSLEAMRASGIDEDISKKLSISSGLVKGAIEEAQYLGYIGPLKRAVGGAVSPVVKTIQKMPGVQRALVELGILGMEGLEESSQGWVDNKAMEKAVEMMKARYGSQWKPKRELPHEDLLRAGIVGGVTAGIMRVSGRAASIPVEVIERARYEKRVLEESYDRFQKDIEENKSLDEIFKPERTGLRTAPIGWSTYQRMLRRGLNEDQVSSLIDRLPYNDLVKLSSRSGIDVRGKNQDDLAFELKNDMGVIKEGPRVEKQVDPSDKRKRITTVVLNTPVLDAVPEADAKIGHRLDKLARNTISNMRVSAPEMPVVPVPPVKPVVVQPMKAARMLGLKFNGVQESGGKPALWLFTDKMTGSTLGAPIDSKLTVIADVLRDTRKRFAGEATANLTPSPEHIKTTRIGTLYDIRRRALIYAGLSDELSRHPDINNLDEVSLTKGDQNIAKILTRTQYAKYRRAMEGFTRRIISRNFGHAALSAVEPRLFYKYKPAPILDWDGKLIDYPMPNLRDMPTTSLLWHYIRAKPWPFIQIANKTGLDLVGFDFALMNRHRQRHEFIQAWEGLRSRIYRDLPKPLARGSVRRTMNDLVVYLMESTDNRHALAKQWGIKEPVQRQLNAVAERVVDASKDTKYTTEEVLHHAKVMVSKYQTMFDWFAKNGAISPEQYRKHYVPIIRRFYDEGGGQLGVSFMDWMEKRRVELKKQRGLSDEQINDMVDLGDTIASLKRKGFAIPGESTPFFEYIRTADKELMGEMSKAQRETNIEDLMDHYISAYTRKIYFEDVTPAVRAFLDTTLAGLRQAGIHDTALKQMMTNYLDDIMGIPSAGTQVARQVNLRSDKYMVTRLINSGMEMWNKKWGHTRWGEFPKEITPTMLADAAMTLVYVAKLGIPNMTSPLKNIASQHPMAAFMGMKTYLEGLKGLNDPERVKEIKSMDLRPEFAIPDFERFAGRGRLRRIAEGFLSVYRASDSVNVMGAASTAMSAWDRLASEFEKNPNLQHMTLDQFTKIVFGEKSSKSLGIDERKVIEKNVSWRDEWKFEGPKAFRGIATEMFDMIHRGKAKDARRMLIQYVVNLSQYRYGTGGTPQIMRNPLGRALFMFTTWPLNYTEYEAMLLNPKNGMLRRALEVHLIQFIIATILSALGYKAYKWVGTGAMPEEFGFFGPVATWINEIFTTLRGAGVAGQAALTPTASYEDQEREIKRMQRAWSDLTE